MAWNKEEFAHGMKCYVTHSYEGLVQLNMILYFQDWLVL